MTRLIPPETLQEIRDRVDIVKLIQRYIELKPAGRNTYKGLCPFHDEKTPSFNVNPDRGSYYCFGCQEGGDVFTFLTKAEGATFVEAVRSLARDAGIEIPEASPGERERAGLAEQLYDANERVASSYRDELAGDACLGAR